MSEWVIDTTNGEFSRSTLEQAIRAVINFHIERDENAYLENICSFENGELLQQLPYKEVLPIQFRIDDEIKDFLKAEKEEQQGFEAIRSDYYANLI